MSTVPQLSVNLLSQAVEALDLVSAAVDYCDALDETALGLPNTTRNIDLATCFAAVDSRSLSTARFVIGPGVARLYGNIVTPNNMSLQDLMTAEFDLDYNTLLGTNSISNAYAFGNVYLDNLVDNSSNHYTSITFELVKGGVGNMGSEPILCTRSFTIEEAQSMLRKNLIPNFASTDRILLYSFVIDIDTYVHEDAGRTSLVVYYADRRHPRGYRGYAEEIMATQLVPAIHQYRGAFSTSSIAIQTALGTLVQSWINLACWTPDFQTYWNANSNLMSDRFKQYLLDAFNIIIT
jgi:hypothetical protein